MVSTTSYALVSAPLVAFGYLATSFAYCELERRQRDDHALRRIPAATVTSFAALLTTTLAYYVTRWIVPVEVGYVLAPVSESLAPWQAVALWTGVAAVLGTVAPIWNGFRGGPALAPAATVAFVYLPFVLLAGIAGWSAGMLVSKRSHVPVHAGLATAVLTAWAGWIFSFGDAWGVALGGQALLATAVTVAVLVARGQLEGRRADAR
jgi:glycerol-3-phosphate acyltransferase PlsY